MEKHYILNGIGAFYHFPANINFSKLPDNYHYQLTSDMLASIRSFSTIRLQPIFVRDPGRSHNRHDGRSVPTISNLNDAYATCRGVYYQITIDDEKFADIDVINAINAALALMDRNIEELTLIPISADQIPRNRIISQDDVIQIYNSQKTERWEYESVSELFQSQIWSTSDDDIALWQIVASIIKSPLIMYAAHFWKSSMEEFSIGDGFIRDVIISHENCPLELSLAVKVENALHNSYKVIEAICGGTLPASKPKLLKKLTQIGVNPHEYVGYQAFDLFKREKIIDKVIKLKAARNERAAHGRIHANRKITFYELMDLQATTNHILRTYITAVYPELRSLWFETTKSAEIAS